MVHLVDGPVSGGDRVGLEVDPDKVKAIIEMSEPRTEKQDSWED